MYLAETVRKIFLVFCNFYLENACTLPLFKLELVVFKLKKKKKKIHEKGMCVSVCSRDLRKINKKLFRYMTNFSFSHLANKRLRNCKSLKLYFLEILVFKNNSLWNFLL